MGATKGHSAADYEAAYARLGSNQAVAREFGVNESTVRRARQRIDPAIRDSMAAVGTDMVPALAWAKVPARDGEPGYSVLLKPQEAPDDTLERIRDAFEGMAAAEPITPPDSVMGDLCSLYPLMDAHIGMHAWGRETGGPDYDLKLAQQDMRHAFAKICALTPNSAQGVLVIGGDFFHQDDTNNETPAHKHKLDVDGRHQKVLETGIELVAEVVELLAGKHENITVRVLRGNHDPHAHLVLTFALAQRYRDNPRIEVDKSPRDLFMMQWGRSAIFAHHGDKAKPDRMALYLSDVCDFWSATKHRHLFTGHVHHDNAKDIGPLRFESLRAFCPPDAYAASMGYAARRALQSVTFDKQDGIVLRALDPIERH